MKSKIAAVLSITGIIFFCAASSQAATVTSGHMKKFLTKNDAALAKTDSTEYTKVGSMHLNFDTKAAGGMLVTYCAESAVDTDGGTIYVRLSADGQFSPSFSIFGQAVADGEYSSQCVQWAFSGIDVGSHSVQVDYRASTGTAYQYYKSLSVQYNK